MRDETSNNEPESMTLEPENIKKMYLAFFIAEGTTKEAFIRDARVQLGMHLGPPGATKGDRELLLRLDMKLAVALYNMLHEALEAVIEEAKNLTDA